MQNLKEINEKIANVFTILVVDDDHENLRMLSICLKKTGHRILVAQDGESALEKVKRISPDLILMDVIMPRMDGFETCRHLKENPLVRDIPVIFMTSLTDVENKIKGFEVGGVDYIAKPFQFDEILARVSIHLKLRYQQRLLEEKAEEESTYNEELIALNEELIALNEELQNTNQELFKEIADRKRVEVSLEGTNEELKRTIEELRVMQTFLIQSEKMAALGNLVAGLAHEINTPIGVALTATTYLSDAVDKLAHDENSSDLKEASTIIAKNLSKAGKLIRNFKLVSADQTSDEKRKINVCEYIDEVLLSLKPIINKGDYTIRVQCDPSLVVMSYPGSIAQILSNLILNAIVHGFEKRESGEIDIKVFLQDENLMIEFTDDGVGMSEDTVAKVFDPFFTTKRSTGGSGLGMYVVYNIIRQQFQGDIHCFSEENKGTKYIVGLPINK